MQQHQQRDPSPLGPDTRGFYFRVVDALRFGARSKLGNQVSGRWPSNDRCGAARLRNHRRRLGWQRRNLGPLLVLVLVISPVLALTRPPAANSRLSGLAESLQRDLRGA